MKDAVYLSEKEIRSFVISKASENLVEDIKKMTRQELVHEYNKLYFNKDESICMDDFIYNLEEKLKEYEKVIQEKMAEGLLVENTANTYLTHSRNFVRWCKGEFNPGEKNKK